MVHLRWLPKSSTLALSCEACPAWSATVVRPQPLMEQRRATFAEAMAVKDAHEQTAPDAMAGPLRTHGDRGPDPSAGEAPTRVAQRTAGRVVVPAAAAGDVTTVDDEAQLADGDELWARICDWARKVWPA